MWRQKKRIKADADADAWKEVDNNNNNNIGIISINHQFQNNIIKIDRRRGKRKNQE
jgi:hypothetical protein